MAKMTKKEIEKMREERGKSDVSGLVKLYGKDGKKQGVAKNPPKRGKST